MHFYSQSHDALMATPIKTFWLMSRNIDRIQAQKDMRSLSVAVCGQGGAAAQDHRKLLVTQVGDIVKLKFDPVKNAVRDEEGFQALKALKQQ